MDDERIRTVVVDDDDDIRALLQMNLEADERFHFAGEASDGSRMLALLLEGAPHVVILDLDMPQVDGLEALRTIHDTRPDAKVVVFSARYDKYDADDLVGGKANLYVDKSRPVPDLLEEIVRLVDGL